MRGSTKISYRGIVVLAEKFFIVNLARNPVLQGEEQSNRDPAGNDRDCPRSDDVSE
jgi:hypothetical protein